MNAAARPREGKVLHLNGLKQEREKLAALSLRQKLRYIWDYYKLWLIGLAAVMLVAGYLVHHYSNVKKETDIYVAFVGTMEDIGQDSRFWQGYVEEAGVDAKTVNVTFDTENYFDMTAGSVVGNHYYEKVVVLSDGGTLDAIVMEPEHLALFGASGRLLDLRDERVAALLDRYADRVITVPYIEENGTVSEVPAGIDLTGSRLIEQEQAYTSCALGISANASHLDAVERFLEYLLQEGTA